MNLLYVLYALIFIFIIKKSHTRLQLSLAKHPSLAGHSKMSRRISKIIPAYRIDDNDFFSADNAPIEIQLIRKNGFNDLKQYFTTKMPNSLILEAELTGRISDIDFVKTYRVPFQFSHYVKANLITPSIVTESKGNKVKDADGNWSYDLTGSYGVNLFGYEFYKKCIEQGATQVQNIGPVLGAYQPLMIENAKLLKDISGLDEVSFHMSGTEAVMQAVRLARYHTGKSHLVRFCGAYHGWWDGVQPGIGNQRNINDIYTLKEMDQQTLKVLKTRSDIACVLVNPLQAMNINSNPPSDAMLISNGRKALFDRENYTHWLQQLREVCTERGIVLIIDEIFVGFRLAYRGAQEYFNIKADMVTYGKTLGGGLPIGVVCGSRALMKRYRDDKPIHICFARGTFNSHPLVMATMNSFLKNIKSDNIQKSYINIDTFWNKRVAKLNQKLTDQNLPIQIVNLVSVWTIIFKQPSRYNWMFQFYLRAQALSISWIGSGRIIMSHDYSDEDYQIVMEKIVSAAKNMKTDGWWWTSTTLTRKSIKRMIIKEFIKKSFF